MVATPPPQPDRPQPPTDDDVVLVDERGQTTGRHPRLEVHGTDTPLHLAFSVHLFNSRGEVLITRRALSKTTWPGVWTNSCCGHPRPEEAIEDAVRRRVLEELGLTAERITPVLPDFRYRAVDASGVVENEICPVFAAQVGDVDPEPDPGEVAEWAWVGWSKLLAAVTATPAVFSPWAVLQVPQVGSHLPVFDGDVAPNRPNVEQFIGDVDQLLTSELNLISSVWQGTTTGVRLDVLAQDLPSWLNSLLVGQGKRLRTTMTYWGHVAAGGMLVGPTYDHLVRAAAALETLHLFALVHDDIMDESVTRRGRPSAHVQAADWHQRTAATGDREVFGRNIAILLGDLAHMLADQLIEDLPARMRQLWYELSLELIAGQRADLTGAAAGRRDLGHAARVSELKSGRYTITRPLQLGALTADADEDVLAALTSFGDHLARAFGLRDDQLGVWGDPAVTGKPAGDDLAEGKATVLLALAAERLSGDSAEMLTLVGGQMSDAEVTQLAEAMRAAGVENEVERLIDQAVSDALACLRVPELTAAGVEGLQQASQAVAWRAA